MAESKFFLREHPARTLPTSGASLAFKGARKRQRVALLFHNSASYPEDALHKIEGVE
jgi:hypothetical protein